LKGSYSAAAGIFFILQRGADDFVHALQPDKIELVARVLRYVVTILSVARRQHDEGKPGARATGAWFGWNWQPSRRDD
jgi:hypothetical protein